MKPDGTPTTLGSLCEQAAQRWPDQTAIRFDADGQTLTFAQLEQRSNQLAHALLQLEIQPGDRVAVMAGNCPIFVLAWLAIGKIGAAMVPINPSYRSADASHLLNHAQVVLAVTDRASAPGLASLRSQVPSLRHHLVDDDLSSLLMSQPTTAPGVLVLPSMLANIQFTSGTTGLPKGCMLSHRYWTQLGHMIAQQLVLLTPRDVMLTAQPFTYIDPQWNVAAALSSGATLVVLERFSPSRFWDKVVQHGVTFFYCLGAMPNLMLAQPIGAAERTHHLRCVMCSGIPAQRHAELEQRFGVSWYEVYGTTETGADLMVWPSMGAELRGSGSVGVALPHREVRVADESGQTLQPGAVGELQLRGTAMMEGYFRAPDATRLAFDLGWYHTGDLARMDTHGHVTIVGRIKDMIRRSGENIAAAEVEAAISLHPKVRQVAVLPVPDSLRGEEVKAFVVLSDHADVSVDVLEEIAKFLLSRLARFKIPRYWEARDSLPLTPSERIAKHLLATEASCANQYDRQAACAHDATPTN